MQKHLCHDCSQELKKGDYCYTYSVEGADYHKCTACHDKDASLRNFRKTEVYSRVVGYIRPVDQWNKGKQAEYSDRQEFVVVNSPKPACC